jgi:phage terminase large subunit-like protein
LQLRGGSFKKLKSIFVSFEKTRTKVGVEYVELHWYAKSHSEVGVEYVELHWYAKSHSEFVAF